MLSPDAAISRLRAPFLRTALLLALLALAHTAFAPAARAQGLSGLEREDVRAMLSIVKDELKKNYYDPKFHGMDVDARFRQAEERLKTATSLGQAFGIIAQALTELEDSHTTFFPPTRAARVEYGWQMQVIGDAAYVVAVKPGSDAEAKGLKLGDRLDAVDGFRPTRANLWKMHYRYYTLSPQPGIRVTAVSPAGERRELALAARVQQGKRVLNFTGDDGGADIEAYLRELQTEARLRRQRYVEYGDRALLWKMPDFGVSEQIVDDLMEKARPRQALVLDLRGNGGGYEKTLLRLVSHVFDREVKIGDIKRRKETKPLLAKRRGKDVFAGKLVVLVDSESGSAAELFARIVQLERRGTVIGDRTSGKVMRSRFHDATLGTNTLIGFGVSITDADIVMTDGKSLEHTGVTPDDLRLPTSADLSARRDPVLAHALALAGIELDPAKAGALFPIEWRK